MYCIVNARARGGFHTPDAHKADAVAGVVNYVTRRGFEGLELNADYRYIEDSDGDYGTDMLWGKNLGAGETQLPLLRTVDLNLAGRYEKFYSDVTDVDNDIFVPAAAIKWQPVDWLGVRTSWGRTFSQVNPPRERDPIFALSTGSTRYIGLGSGTLPSNTGPATYSTFDFPNVDIKPEKGEYFTVGFLLNAGNFAANVDYAPSSSRPSPAGRTRR